MKRYHVRYLGQKLGEQHWGIFDIERNDFLERDGIRECWTDKRKAEAYAEELNKNAEVEI